MAITEPRVDVTERIRVHDVDTHLLEPADLWTARVSSKWGDAVPHVEHDPELGVDLWVFGGQRIVPVGNYAPAGWRDFWPSRPPTFAEIDPGAWQPQARLAWMDQHGVFSQVLYPNLLGFYSRAFLEMDDELRMECVRAYNDFQSEFCAVAPERLIALTCLPFWDREASIAEAERGYAMGHRGVNLGWEYEKLGLPALRDDHWEPLLKLVEEMGSPVNFHIGFNTMAGGDFDRFRATLLDSLDIAKLSALTILGNQSCIAELIMGRICHRYPALRFVSVESGVGYVPYLLDAMDWQFKNNGCGRAHPEMLLPTEYFRRQIYGTFWFEHHVDRLVDLYPDNFMFESDYPHPTSLSPGPNTYAQGPRETIAANLSSLPDDLLRKVLHDNAAAVYGLS